MQLRCLSNFVASSRPHSNPARNNTTVPTSCLRGSVCCSCQVNDLSSFYAWTCYRCYLSFVASSCSSRNDCCFLSIIGKTLQLRACSCTSVSFQWSLPTNLYSSIPSFMFLGPLHLCFHTHVCKLEYEPPSIHAKCLGFRPSLEDKAISTEVQLIHINVGSCYFSYK